MYVDRWTQHRWITGFWECGSRSSGPWRPGSETKVKEKVVGLFLRGSGI